MYIQKIVFCVFSIVHSFVFLIFQVRQRLYLHILPERDVGRSENLERQAGIEGLSLENYLHSAQIWGELKFICSEKATKI